MGKGKGEKKVAGSRCATFRAQLAEAQQTIAELREGLRKAGEDLQRATDELARAYAKAGRLRRVRDAALEYLMRSVADPNCPDAEDALRKALADYVALDAAKEVRRAQKKEALEEVDGERAEKTKETTDGSHKSG